MKRRQAWFGGAGMYTLLLGGCLFQQNTAPQAPADPGKAREIAKAPEVEPLPSPPAPPSDYHPREGVLARPAAYSGPTGTPRDEAQPVSRTLAPDKAPEYKNVGVESPLVGALRCAMEKHPAEARRLLEKYDKNDRELLMALLRLTAELGDRDMEKLPPDEVARTLEQLASLTSNLRVRAPLALDRVCFCRKIQGFGRYEQLPVGTEFQAGSEGKPGERVQVYVEVRNFARRPAEGNYETVLQSKLEIRDAQSREVAAIDLGRCVDRSQTPRQDYFLNFQLHVPPALPPGLYTLWVKVQDVTNAETPREATSSLDFKVRAPCEVPAAATK